jgi:N-carbamoyl-L-amino-acid hydrolase
MGVVNCGDIQVFPGAFNIVPGQVRLALEFRHSDADRIEAMREALINLALHVVEVEGLNIEIEQVGIHDPATLHRDVINVIQGACDVLGLRHVELASYAGHDTQIMSHITRAGMFFVPSVEGVSHNPREFTHEQDCINAGNVLLQTVLKMVFS